MYLITYSFCNQNKQHTIFRFIYCFSDPPHLIKTVRNCWASKKRSLWVNACVRFDFLFSLYFVCFQNNGKSITWQHLINLYTKDSGKGSGLSMVPKLKFEHLNLTPFSKMRVDLAAQVCGIIFFTSMLHFFYCRYSARL